MKKIFYFLAAAAVMFAMTACGPKENKAALDFEKCYNADYDYMLEQLESDTNFLFYFAEAKMSMKFNDPAFEKEAYVQRVTVLFQSDIEQMVYRFTHEKDSAGNDMLLIEKIPGVWMECMRIDRDDVDVTLDSAINLLFQADVVKPESQFVVLRRPVCPAFPEKPYYIFGNARYNVTLDLNDMSIKSDGYPMENTLGLMK